MRSSTNLEWWRQLHPSEADLKSKAENSNKLIQKTTNSMMKMKRGKKLTENSGFSSIVETENKDSSFLVTEKRGKQFREH